MKLKYLVSNTQFENAELPNELFESALDLEEHDRNHTIPQTLQGKVVACLFYEPSTRTRLSFETAIQKLGGGVIGAENAVASSSATKGESLEDTIHVVSSLSDAVVMRHPEVGSAKRAAEVSLTPLVNAGDGSGDHPTQGLLDLLTIKKELGRLDNFSITFLGDLLYGRAMHSVLHLLRLYKGITVNLVSPPQLKLPDEYKEYMKQANIIVTEQDDLDGVLSSTDVLYVTRIQKERFASETEYEKLKGLYIVDKKVAERLRPDAIIMHPLPRVNEIAPEVDNDVRAVYFKQAKNGLYLRMALLQYLLTGQ